MRILLINGPNLNLLGLREPEIYGSKTLADVEAECSALAKQLRVEFDCYQSNYEGGIVTRIQEARQNADAIIINAGAYTHTSVAVHDALRAFEGKIIELHISNPHQREEFRHKSFIAPVAMGIIAGFGTAGYTAAIRSLAGTA